MAAIATTTVGTVQSLIAPDRRSYTVKYLVTTDDADDQAIAAINASGIPRRLTHYECGNDSDSGAWVSAYRPSLVREDGSRKLWSVLVDFETPDPNSTSTDRDNSVDPWDEGVDVPPWMRPAQISGFGEGRLEVAEYHYTDPDTPTTITPIYNPVGDLYTDILQWDFYESLIITKAYQGLDLDDVFTNYVNHVNKTTFFSFAADKWLLKYPRWQKLWTGGGVPYYEITYEFLLNTDGWNPVYHVIDGERYRDVTDGDKLKLFKDDEDFVRQERGLLAPDGTPLPDTGEPEFEEFNLYARAEFSELDIPTGFDNG
jgi:hypothetical protein